MICSRTLFRQVIAADSFEMLLADNKYTFLARLSWTIHNT